MSHVICTEQCSVGCPAPTETERMQLGQGTWRMIADNQWQCRETGQAKTTVKAKS